MRTTACTVGYSTSCCHSELRKYNCNEFLDSKAGHTMKKKEKLTLTFDLYLTFDLITFNLRRVDPDT